MTGSPERPRPGDGPGRVTGGLPRGRPGGWQPDPAERFEERYYVAGRWTRRVRWGGCEAVDLQALDADGPPPTDWQRRPDHADADDRGWCDDPAGRFPERWWDGGRYTRKVRVGEAVATDTVGAPQTRGVARGDDERDVPAPGWRDDPDGHGERYWDGYRWTAKWRAGPAGSPDHSMRGWWSRTVLMAAGAVLVVVVVLALLIALILAL